MAPKQFFNPISHEFLKMMYLFISKEERERARGKEIFHLLVDSLQMDTAESVRNQELLSGLLLRGWDPSAKFHLRLLSQAH